MPTYCLNKNAQSTGEHEVHEVSPTECNHLPDPANREDLGWHSSCHGAVAEAESRHSTWDIDGCKYCCEPCHNK